MGGGQYCQMIEIQSSHPYFNTITTVQKDNLIIEIPLGNEERKAEHKASQTPFFG